MSTLPRKWWPDGELDRMNTTDREIPELELALLRRSLPRISADCERCGSCLRSMLIGERVYEYPSGALRCELCRDHQTGVQAEVHTVHGPEFGHTMRLVDRRRRAA
jgi:hypothetical protein